jgi:intracellular sulfur oxidation DsrE/DsrF family protein
MKYSMASRSAILILTAMIIGVLLTGCGGSYSGLKKAKNGFKKQQVVYHVNDINKAFGALRNVKNHLNALGDKNAEIIVVTHSSGAFTLVDGSQDKRGRSFEATVQTLANRGVKFEICANTIRGKKIDKNKINLNATVVPSGVARVADLQQRGYIYVKP